MPNLVTLLLIVSEI